MPEKRNYFMLCHPPIGAVLLAFLNNDMTKLEKIPQPMWALLNKSFSSFLRPRFASFPTPCYPSLRPAIYSRGAVWSELGAINSVIR